MKKYKKRIFEIIQIGNKSDLPSTVFDVVISTLIVLSISVTFLQTFESLTFIRPVLSGIEFFTIVVFLIEYLLRLWTAGYLFKKDSYGMALVKYIFSFYGIVDLLTIISYFVPFLFTNGFVALRMLRVVRIMRLFKLNSSYDAFNVITDVLKEKKDQIISSVFMIVILMFMSSMCMYSFEHEAQPENFTNAFDGIWWATSTLLTVGYGDIYPITYGGKLMAIFIAFLGVGMVAIPTGIISAGFVEHYGQIKKGTYAQTNLDHIVITLTEKHGFVGKKISDIQLTEGLYTAVVVRGDEVLTPYEDLILKSYDNLLLVSTSNHTIDSRIDEIKLVANHPWINQRIKDLDISRKIFIIMVRRKFKTIKPEGNTRLQEDDVVVVLDKR